MEIINRWSKWTSKNITFSVPCESDNSRLYHESELYTSKVFFNCVRGRSSDALTAFQGLFLKWCLLFPPQIFGKSW